MSELDLYKYLFDQEDGLNPEMHWHGDELNIFLYYFQVEDFMEFIDASSSGIFDDDGGHLAHLKGNYLVFDLVPICEFHDIEPANILAKGESTR